MRLSHLSVGPTRRGGRSQRGSKGAVPISSGLAELIGIRQVGEARQKQPSMGTRVDGSHKPRPCARGVVLRSVHRYLAPACLDTDLWRSEHRKNVVERQVAYS